MIYSNLRYFLIILMLLYCSSACFIKEKCYSNEDCPNEKICDRNSGECKYQCYTDSDCGTNFECRQHRCMPKSSDKLDCPSDMANIEDSFCMDIYEASRPDATSDFAGKDNSYATSRKGVLPWMTKDNSEAEMACKNAGKRLCTQQEWYYACAGGEGNIYSYGNKYDPVICNGIDTFCNCNSEECTGLRECPYPHCYNEKSAEGKGPCGSDFHIMPTGSFPGCKNKYGVYDLNGNVWEHTANGSEYTVRGGAYNCGDSEMLHRCDYIPTNWKPSALGFRCCKGRESISDAGYDTIPNDAKDTSEIGDSPSDSAEDLASAEDKGCIEEDITTYDSTSEDIQFADENMDTSDISDTQPDTESQDISDTESNDIISDTGIIKDCPSDMVNVNNQFCMDKYEASRPDATDSFYGTDTSYATSRENVIPWYPVTLSIAREACRNAGKRLCRPEEWYLACSQGKNYSYVYGNTYNPAICNGIDAFCNCENPQCSSLNTCPYAHCYNQSSPEGGGPCGAAFRVMPTGYFKDCRNEWGAFDINGNVWEVVDTEDGLEHFRGGAYNCGDSEMLHRCDYDATWGPSAKGFRCCKDLE